MFGRFNCMKKDTQKRQETAANNTFSNSTPAQTEAMRQFKENTLRDCEQLVRQMEEIEKYRVKF